MVADPLIDPNLRWIGTSIPGYQLTTNSIISKTIELLIANLNISFATMTNPCSLT